MGIDRKLLLRCSSVVKSALLSMCGPLAQQREKKRRMRISLESMCVFWCGGTLFSKCVLISTKTLMFTKSACQHPLKYQFMKLGLHFIVKNCILSFLSWSFCQLKKTSLLLLLETCNFTHWSEHWWLHLKVHCDSSFLKISHFLPFLW